MHREEFSTYFDRCSRFFKRNQDDIFVEFLPLEAEYARTAEPVAYSDRLKLKYKPIREGEDWGGPWDSGWFHISCELPPAWRKGDLALYANFSGEALVFDAKGVPAYGLTARCAFNRHYTKELYRLAPATVKNGRLDLWIETAGNMLFGVGFEEEPHLLTGKTEPDFIGRVQKLRLARIRPEVEAFFLDYEIAFGVLEQLPRDDYRNRKLLKLVSDACDAYAENPDNAAAARKVLKRFWENRAADSALNVTAVGHAHIDTGWLWPVRETIRKCARTYASQLALMDEYKDYIFGASAPQHYAYVKKHYPELYAKVKKRVAEGRWELQGGMWVEADCNIISGESMARQFIHGKNFYMDEFGADVNNLWIPDVFGYSGSMPQFIKKSGCDYFLTQKISWNKVNVFPFHSFIWRGIDGSEVLTHFPPENNYNADVCPRELIAAQNRYNEGDITDCFISLYGIGDGGGGPSEKHVERLLRSGDVEGLPKVKFGRADSFFKRLDGFRKQLPNWVGELYLELHRGTLTTQARTKRNNRKCEQALAAVEFLWSALDPAVYPAAELDELWKLLLLNQFHDIIPGSSIGKVYEVTEKEHAEILKRCDKLMAKAAAKLGSKDADSVMVCNTLGTAFTHRFELPESFRDARMTDESGHEVPLTFDGARLWASTALPAGSFTTLRRTGKKKSAVLKSAKVTALENELVRYEFAANGELLRAFDKEFNREILKPGEKGNRLRLFADYPTQYEAWDVEVFAKNMPVAEAAAAAAPKVSLGTEFSTIEFSIDVGGSIIAMSATLERTGKLLRFEGSLDWQQARKLLKVEFPVAIFASEATFDIQYGSIKRPTHRNTSWDAARFESAAQRYVDLSEAGYGVSLLNDGKYGHSIQDGMIGLSLLRAPKHPDMTADLGQQVFCYALLPHAGNAVEANIYAAAAEFNRAPQVFSGMAAAKAAPVTFEGAHISMEAVKKAEKSDDLIVRLVETAGAAAEGVLKVAAAGAKVEETNLIEWTCEGKLKAGRNGFKVALKPFEIKTLRISRGK